MHRLGRLAACLLVLGACRSAAPPPAPSLQVVIVRHAETAPDGTRDPSLSDAGRERAAALASRLAPERVVAVYATEYRRTQETARAIADAAGLDVTVEPVGGSVDAFIDRLADRVRGHVAADGGTVVVVGHSNTVPALAEALAGEPVAPIAEDEYDRVVGVTLTATGGRLTAPPAPR